MTIANEIWIATALLQRDHSDRPDFSVRDIVERVLREGLDEYRAGLQAHASGHCVADKRPTSVGHRYLHETKRGRRRLYRTGDPFHPNRRSGRTHPSPDDLPEPYRYLVEWYETQFNVPDASSSTLSHSIPKGTALLRFFGSASQEDVRGMQKAIHQGCEQVDANEW